MTGNLLLIFHGKQRGEIKTMKTELLAPAGSYEAMTAAFAAGADAVYIGGQKFGARAYADNLDTDQMMDAIAYARLHGKSCISLSIPFLKSENWRRNCMIICFLSTNRDWMP